MAVYVDPMMPTARSRRWPFTASCHLYADDPEELHRFARRLGLKRAWFQREEDTGLAHYDLVATRRQLAVRLGAQRHGFHEAAEYFARNRVRD